MTTDEKLKYALEEINHWLRYFDNFYWVLSSFWITGTGFAISKALKWKGCDWHIVGLSLIVIVAWILFQIFTNYVCKISSYYLEIVNKYEKDLSIDILPKKPIKGKGFMFIMKIITVLSIVVMIGFIIEYLLK